MRLVRSLQHWLSGTGTPLQVTDFVPDTHPIRRWADTFPWAALVSAIEHGVQKRFPTSSRRGRRPVSIRVLLALEVLKHAWGASDEALCQRLRTDVAVMDACGLRAYPSNPSPAHFGLPETLCEFRGRRDEALREELMASQAAAAMDEGLVSPAHLVIDPFPCEQGSQRVTDATTLSKAQKNARTRRAHRARVPPPGDPTPPASPQPPTREQKSPAELWPQLPGPRSCLCHAGSPHRTAPPGTWRAHQHLCPTGHATSCTDRDAA